MANETKINRKNSPGVVNTRMRIRRAATVRAKNEREIALRGLTREQAVYLGLANKDGAVR